MRQSQHFNPLNGETISSTCDLSAKPRRTGAEGLGYNRRQALKLIPASYEITVFALGLCPYSGIDTSRSQGSRGIVCAVSPPAGGGRGIYPLRLFDYYTPVDRLVDRADTLNSLIPMVCSCLYSGVPGDILASFMRPPSRNARSASAKPALTTIAPSKTC